MGYTKQEKERLVAFLQHECERRIAKLENDCKALASETEAKMLRRLNNVSATLWNIKLKDVLMVERHHKPTIKHLVADIQTAKQEPSFLNGHLTLTPGRGASASSAEAQTFNNSSSHATGEQLKLAREKLRSVSDSRVSKPQSSGAKSRTRTVSSGR